MPHVALFSIYSVIYMLPVVYVYLFGFSEGGLSSLQLTDDKLSSMVIFYFVSMIGFYFGSWLFCFGMKKQHQCFSVLKFKINSVFGLILSILIVLYLCVKLLLYKEGVYDSYAFDSGAMGSKVWTVSMALSELLVMFYVFTLFSSNVKMAFFLFLLIAMNLLHGTRIFTSICVLCLFFYYVFYLCKYTKLQVLIGGFSAFIILLFGFYYVFASRSGIQVDIAEINFEMLFSPIIYESIFNQISFMKMLDFLNSGEVPFAPHMLFSDAVIFILPNMFSESKFSFMYELKFGQLSPLGGLSGYASSIIYFSNFYFLWYFLLGGISSLLFRWSRSNTFPVLSRTIYVYFVCDSLFRFQRDPFYIVIKMLVNNLMALVALFLLMNLCRCLFNNEKQ